MKQKNIVAIETNEDHYFEKQQPFPGIESTVKKDKAINYRVSLQSGLWNKKVFQGLLKETESAWTFELEGTERSRTINEAFLAVLKDAPFKFINACQLGFLQDAAVPILVREGVRLDSIRLPITSEYPFTLWLRSKVRPKRFRLWMNFLKLVDPKLSKAHYSKDS